jgi:hypothetical protein
MLAEYGLDQLRPATRYVLSIRSHTPSNVPLKTLVVATYCACRQDIAWQECLSLRHGLEKIGNAEDQVIGGRILTQVSVDTGLNPQDFVRFASRNSNRALIVSAMKVYLR